MSEVKLTPQQKDAVEHRDSTILVSAAAGSGKTKVLIDRVLCRVETENRNIDDFLMITYTKAAAAELRDKLIDALSKKLAQQPDNRELQQQMSRVYLAQISTVHSLCTTLLRDYAHELGLPADFRICDEQDALLMKNRAMRTVLDNAYKDIAAMPEIAAALDILGAGRDDKDLPKLILRLHTDVQCTIRPKKRFEQLRQSLDVSACADVSETDWGRYLIQSAKSAFLREADKMQRCKERAEKEPGFPKHPAAFEGLSLFFKSFAQKNTWQELGTVRAAFKSMPAIKEDSALKEYFKAMKKKATETADKWINLFSRTSEEIFEELAASALPLRGLVELTERFTEQYQDEKKRRHVLDYSDLEHETLRLLYGNGETPTKTAKELSKRYTELMIDEYQDTNTVQDAIFAALSDKGNNLFFVGDVKQSIYRFRQADPTIFLEKYNRFADKKDARKGEPCRILLSDNFRSHPAILSAANDVFRLCMTPRVGGLYYTDNEALRPNREMPDMGVQPVELHCINTAGLSLMGNYANEDIEAECIARRIAEMLSKEEKIPDGKELRTIGLKDIVILTRKLSKPAKHYMKALQRYGIPCICGSDNLFDAEEIAFITALLQVIDNPHQDIPLLAVLFSPVFCFTANELALLRGKKSQGDLYATLADSERGSQFLQTLELLRNAARQESISELLDTVDAQLSVRTIYAGAQAQKNLDSFFSLANSYEKRNNYALPDFLRYLDGLKEKGGTGGKLLAGDAVRIMTIHSTKGLQFPVVFLANIGGEFNKMDTSNQIQLDPVLGIAGNAYDTENHTGWPTVAKYALIERKKLQLISEEMCLLYVAMTRAEYRLIMTYCNGKVESTLKDIAKNLTVPAEDSIIEGVNGAGKWILMTALTHTEAGVLFTDGGNPEISSVSDYPWTITYRPATAYLPCAEETQSQAEGRQMSALLPWLPYAYAHTPATTAPSKLTATQLKGRAADNEAAEQTITVMPPFRFNTPRFEKKKGLNAAERGTALHLAMQFLEYSRCGGTQAIQAELGRLVRERRMTQEQADAVAPEKLLRFFASELGKRVLAAEKLVREFKFSILEDAQVYDPALAGEKILLQGVTDCCIVEADGLIIIDFKTDAVTAETLPERAEHYRGQLDAYSRALSRIFKLPVKERILYFFATDSTYPMP